MKVRSFEVSNLPSFPDGDMLPQIEDQDEFDNKLKSWWDEVKTNLSKQSEQIEELKRRIGSLEENL